MMLCYKRKILLLLQIFACVLSTSTKYNLNGQRPHYVRRAEAGGRGTAEPSGGSLSACTLGTQLPLHPYCQDHPPQIWTKTQKESAKQWLGPFIATAKMFLYYAVTFNVGDEMGYLHWETRSQTPLQQRANILGIFSGDYEMNCSCYSDTTLTTLYNV